MAPATTETAGGGRVVDCREPRPDPSHWRLGLPHQAGDAGCTAFRQAVAAKRLRAPAGGWLCVQVRAVPEELP